ncbi:sensor histidine kinase [Treponema ruminis]|uniref:Signal transduction histidine kinase n=1 Tax=Treponema ruminis TaxID=744515 RepID=A0A7W8GB71_9SPIR|nr:sensor histidine kinase [Treponema ruminis]MBB5227228.1 signal transduction histidine kinase [Treponema ruminis]QSI01543.1 sensor histidine kinase [Treponema ruminis]
MADSAELQRLYGIIHSYTVFFIIFDIVFFVIVLGGVGLLIRYLKSQKKLRSSGTYLRYIIRGQEEERSRVARELHDTVAQDLRYCRSLVEKIDDNDLRENLSKLLDKSVHEVRSMSYNLSPPDVTKNDLSANIMNLCQNFTEQSQVEFRMVTPGKTDTSFLSKEENFNIYRIVQESLNNILKHARAEEVTVLLRNEIGDEEKGLYIFITDDGIGFDTRRNYSSGNSHFGLLGMTQRAELINAKLEISSEIGAGSQIKLVKLKMSPSVGEGVIKFKNL